MELSEFRSFPYPVQQDHISKHQWYMGEKFKRPVNRGEAVIDFHETILKRQVSHGSRFISIFGEYSYRHCISCGEVYKQEIKPENFVVKTSKSLSGEAIKDVFITGTLCNICDMRRMFNKLGFSS